MTRARLRKLEQRLLSEHRYLAASIAAANERARHAERADRDEVLGVGFGGEDSGTIIARELEAMLSNRETQELLEVDAALRLLYNDPERYGRCVRCGARIPAARLELLPWTRICGAHEPRAASPTRRAS